MQYVGVDLHARSSSMVVLHAQSPLVWSQTRSTSGEDVVRLVAPGAAGVLEKAFSPRDPPVAVQAAVEQCWPGRGLSLKEETTWT